MADPEDPPVDDDYKPLNDMAAAVTTTVATAFGDLPAGRMLLPWWLQALVSLVAEGAMVFGGVVPFVPQISQIRKTRTCEGFNTLVCFNLMIANILRILFWFGRPFELPLLAQSILMVGMMLFMMHVCVETYRFEQKPSVRIFGGSKTMAEFYKQFWTWTDYSDYLMFTCLFTISVGALTYFCIKVHWYIETLGFLAVFIEAIQGLPQFARNLSNRSTEGMNVVMVCCWLSGDTFKTVYFFARDAPLQFGLCGSLQICVDISLLLQVFFYRGNRAGPSLPIRRKKSVS